MIEPAAHTVNRCNGAPAAQPTAEKGALYVLPETDLEEILRELESLKPNVAVIDRRSTFQPDVCPGSVAQVRECTSALMQVAKREDMHYCGTCYQRRRDRGTKVLEHLVDTVLYFEEIALPVTAYCAQSKIAGHHEIGVFEMIDRGLRKCRTPRSYFR